MEHYTGLFGWMDDEEAQIEAQEARRREKEASEAFDKMMENPEQILDRIFKGIWTVGGNK
jgi:hypothetical protein